MPQDRSRPLIWCISDCWLAGGKLVDATRFGFVNQLAAHARRLVFVHSNSLGSHEQQAGHLRRLLREEPPDLVLSVNASGLYDDVMQHCERSGVPVLTWYWDHPDLLEPMLVQNSLRTQLFHAGRDCVNNAIIAGRGEWLPFSGLPSELAPPDPDAKGLCFLGTLWGMHRPLVAASVGLVDERGRYLFGEALYDALRKPKTTEFWQTRQGLQVRNGELVNALASLYRIRALSWLADFDLRIYGEHSWKYYLWFAAPELLARASYRLVASGREMKALLRAHVANVNIFHAQNSDGGPNFRIFDSATYGCPALSVANPACATIFPHGEAVHYFSNPKEAWEGAQRIAGDPGYAERLRRGAAEILDGGHTHRHRVEYLLRAAGIVPAREGVAEVRVESAALRPDAFANEGSAADLAGNVPAQPDEDPLMQVESWFANLPLVAQESSARADAQAQQLALAQQQIAALHAELNAIRHSRWFRLRWYLHRLKHYLLHPVDGAARVVRALRGRAGAG